MKSSSKLWRHANFLRFWSANIISDFGSGITFLALPIIGAVMLEATAGQMGLLSAAGTLPYLLFGLPVGVFVDQRRKRPLLILADVGRLILIGTLPLAAPVLAAHLAPPAAGHLFGWLPYPAGLTSPKKRSCPASFPAII
ncbi:MAG: MFS transporter [Ardenticatenaceae bacterium]|nr:MFS transporter [Ardenticatenaceae bacterium]